ncbi:tRNA-dihydrouridine synthase 2 [Coemansia thaxteri]|nr:tRNA-dihydrouridine synthase 2 [Coemansia thaxteri]KAJ2470161.1 tRNA-dihydrouridine synthase 2 [Coemansia sp. RSA 2322]KAJ2479653.1 tRNA-dihydrouridine synthase 2 [Coemansia sp. RSA 2320]
MSPVLTAPESKHAAWKDKYRSGFFLAPMVRVGTLPMRLLSLRYGADLVWTPEIVDKSIIGCERVVDDKTGVITYMKNNKDIFTTHPSERQKVVFQLGSAGPETALAAARTVEQDVAGFDLNCGCPKKFSLQGGMGAALMSDPARLCSILEALVAHIDLPITCKIRVFDDAEQTLALVRQIAATGISALTVHCRTRDMRPRHKAMWNRLNDVVRELPHLPIILNGDVFEFADVQRAREATGASSVMTARGAAANPSIFRRDGKVSDMDAAVEYTKYAVRTSSNFIFAKYTLLQMYPDTKSESFFALRSTRRYKDMCQAMGLAEFYQSEGKELIGDRAEPPDAGDADSDSSPNKRAVPADTAPLLATDVAPETVAKRVKP